MGFPSSPVTMGITGKLKIFYQNQSRNFSDHLPNLVIIIAFFFFFFFFLFFFFLSFCCPSLLQALEVALPISCISAVTPPALCDMIRAARISSLTSQDWTCSSMDYCVSGLFSARLADICT